MLPACLTVCRVLGRRLIIAQPDANSGELESGEEVFSCFVIARCDPSKVFDLIEEPFDEVARFVEEFVEADWAFAIGLGRDVRPCPSFGHRLAQRVRVVPLVGEKHRALWEFGDQLGRVGDVARLTGRQFELDRSPLLVDEGMDFGREASSGTPKTSIAIPLFAAAPCWWTRTTEVSSI